MGAGITLGISGWRLQGQRTGIGRYVASLLQHIDPPTARNSFSRINVYTPAAIDRSGLYLPDTLDTTVLASTLPMIAWDNLRLGPSARESVVLYPSFSRPVITRGASVVVTHDATMRVVP
ncbi:MAG: hypothetical protein WKF55_16090, partial [Gemmatimonadaceae bacterium]